MSALPILLPPPKIELCDTPVEGARSINDVAQGVAFCKMGLLINGLDACTAGRVEDFDIDDLDSPILESVGIVVVLGKGIGFSEIFV